MAKRETCFHCEPIEARRRLLEPHEYCAFCQPPEAVAEFDERLVRARLQVLLRWQHRGLRRGSQIGALLEASEIQDALRAASAAGVLNGLESAVVVHRLVQGLGRRQTAGLICDVASGRHPSEATVKRALKSGTKKLADWLNGDRRPDAPDPEIPQEGDEDYVPADPHDPLTA